MAATSLTSTSAVPRAADPWAAVAAIVGGTAVLAGVALPWLSTLAGLQTLTGLDGTNGRVLAAGGVLAIILGATNLRPMPQPVRRATGLLGFAMLASSTWLLVMLLLTYRDLSANPFALAELGPGLFVATAGAAVVFAPALRAGSDTASTAPAAARDGSPLLVVFLGACSLLAGVLHLALSGEHLADGPVTAAAFAALGVGQVVAAALLVLRPTRRTLRAAAILNAGAILGWGLNEAGLLPLLHASSSSGHHGLAPLATVAAEAVVVVLGLRHLMPSR